MRTNRSNRVGYLIRQGRNGVVCFVAAILLVAGVGVFGQTLPDEVAIAKSKFLKSAEALATGKPDDLNGKYLAGLEAMMEKRRAAGDLEGVLAIKAEIDALESTGAPGSAEVSDDTGLPEMRKIYVAARRKWHNARIDRLEAMKRGYLATLEKIVKEFTKEGKIDEALAVRAEADTVAALVLKDFGKGKSSSPVAMESSGTGAGQVRGFGRLATSADNRDWVDFDLKVLEKYTDFVDVMGTPYVLNFRRANGDVLNQKGEVVGKNAKKLIASGSLSGYVDGEGKYHVITDVDAPEEAQPVKSIQKFFNRRIGVKENGDVVAWGGEYNDGKRKVPAEAQKGIKQVAVFYDQDMALSESGVLYRWDHTGLVEHHERLRSNIEKISVFSYTGYALSRDNDLYYLNGNLPPFWNEKAKNVICRGELTAILDMENRWHLFAYQKTPMGNELEVLGVVMNRPETIDVEFYLYYSARQNNNTASYAVWIEEPGTAQLNVKDVKSLPTAPATPRPPGTGFFGVELD